MESHLFSGSARRTVAAVTALATVGVSVGGCYRYTPIDGAAPPAGGDVRVQLTDAGAVQLAPLIGNRIESVDGRVSAVADTAVVLEVRMTTDRLGSEVPWNGEVVTFPRSTIARLEARSFDRKRSWLVGGLTTAAALAVGLAFGLEGNGGGVRGGPSGSPK